MSAIPPQPTKQTDRRAAASTAILRLWKLVFLSGTVAFAVLFAIFIALLTADLLWRRSGGFQILDLRPGSLIFSVSLFGDLVSLAVAMIGAIGWLITWSTSRFWKKCTSLPSEHVKEHDAALNTVGIRTSIHTASDNPYESPRNENLKSNERPGQVASPYVRLAVVASGVLCACMAFLFALTAIRVYFSSTPGRGPSPGDATFHFVLACVMLLATFTFFRSARKRRHAPK